MLQNYVGNWFYVTSAGNKRALIGPTENKPKVSNVNFCRNQNILRNLFTELSSGVYDVVGIKRPQCFFVVPTSGGIDQLISAPVLFVQDELNVIDMQDEAQKGCI